MASHRRPANNGQALLAALAGLHAYEAGLPADKVLALAEDAPAESFVALAAVAGRLAQEVRSLGGDPGVLLARMYDAASELAYT